MHWEINVDKNEINYGFLIFGRQLFIGQNNTLLNMPLKSKRGKSMIKRILVIGSVNWDTFININRFPNIGETLPSSGESLSAAGGKGANQAVACIRCSIPTQFIGQWGNDVHGTTLKTVLHENGIDISLCRTVPGATGQALIFRFPSGDNSIVLIGGANQKHWPSTNDDDDDILPDEIQEAIQNASMILLQREIPDGMNSILAQFAHGHGIPVMLDMGGNDADLDPFIFNYLTYLCPNATELQNMTGQNVATLEDAIAVGRTFVTKYPDVNLLVTVGDQGACLLSSSSQYTVQSVPVDQVVDTTGAGDCFRAVFAVAIVNGASPQEALRRAAQSSAQCITKTGGLESMPFVGIISSSGVVPTDGQMS